MITITHKGDFKPTLDFLAKCDRGIDVEALRKYGEMGVQALREATPKDTGKTANSWSYEIIRKTGSVTLQWKNTNIVDGVPVAIVLQYGHATKTGGYVEGRDYINPALQPVFDEIVKAMPK